MLFKAVQIADDTIMFPNGVLWRYENEKDIGRIPEMLSDINSRNISNALIGGTIGVVASLGVVLILYHLTHKGVKDASEK